MPAVHADRLRIAEASGVEAVRLGAAGTAPDQIITRDASRSPAKSPLPRNSLIHEQLREQLPAGQTRTFRARGHDGEKSED